MVPNANVKVAHHQMVVEWIRLRQTKKLKETKPNGQLTSRTVNCSGSEILVIIKVIKMINDINNNSNSNNNNNIKMQRQI